MHNSPVPTPYAQHVGDRDPVDVLRTSFEDYCVVGSRLTPALWATPWSPGKWTAHQIMVHVTQWEMILGVRLRCGVAVPDYVVQPIEQDQLMKEADAVDGPMAHATFAAVRRMNLALAESLSAEQRKIRFRHPERGPIDVEDLLVTLAGHGVHHLKQLTGLVE